MPGGVEGGAAKSCPYADFFHGLRAAFRSKVTIELQ
jgi:hypothetical protein